MICVVKEDLQICHTPWDSLALGKKKPKGEYDYGMVRIKGPQGAAGLLSPHPLNKQLPLTRKYAASFFACALLIARFPRNTSALIPFDLNSFHNLFSLSPRAPIKCCRVQARGTDRRRVLSSGVHEINVSYVV
jgi:hypothetical protein